MPERRQNKIKLVLLGGVAIVLIAIMTFLAVQFFTKTGIFKIPGVVYYDESLTNAEVEKLKTIFDGQTLEKDVTISASNSFTRPPLKTGEFLTDITVAVADFYSTETNVEAETPRDLVFSQTSSLIPLDRLDFTAKLLSINGNYYLDTFDSGALFRILKFESETYETEVEPLVKPVYTKTFPSKDTVLTLAETGVTAFSRGMNTKLKQVGGGAYFAENLKDYLPNFDLTHTSNEASFSSNAPAASGTTVICSYPEFIDAITALGIDIIELTGNHNQDCGDEAARNTIDLYHEKGIQTVGGGKTATEAAKPLEISEKGTHITMLGFNQSTGGTTIDNTPGANQYNEKTAKTQIETAKKNGDFVIVQVQYYECNSYDYTTENTTCDYADSAAGDQIGFFRHLIDLGADMVVGTAAHQPQTFELYGDGVIYYGLGNLFFDQVYWPGTTRSLILANYFYEDKLLQTKVVPTVYDNTYQTRLLNEETAKWFLERLIAAKP